MLKAFFHWENSLNAQNAFRPLSRRRAPLALDAVLILPTDDVDYTGPQYEWAAKVLLFAEDLAFCARPMSAINAVAYEPTMPTDTNFSLPFGARHHRRDCRSSIHVLRQLGNPWQERRCFVRACMIDCILETDRAKFIAKGNAYLKRSSALMRGLRPSLPAGLSRRTPPDTRRGLKENVLFVDRFLVAHRQPPNSSGLRGRCCPCRPHQRRRQGRRLITAIAGRNTKTLTHWREGVSIALAQPEENPQGFDQTAAKRANFAAVSSFRRGCSETGQIRIVGKGAAEVRQAALALGTAGCPWPRGDQSRPIGAAGRLGRERNQSFGPAPSRAAKSMMRGASASTSS